MQRYRVGRDEKRKKEGGGGQATTREGETEKDDAVREGKIRGQFKQKKIGDSRHRTTKQTERKTVARNKAVVRKRARENVAPTQRRERGDD